MARQYFAAWLAAMVQVWAGVVPAAEPAASGDDAAVDLSMFEATVTASRRREVAIESPRAVSVLHRDEMDRRLTRTTPEALIEEPGVFVQRTYYGGGAPSLSLHSELRIGATRVELPADDCPGTPDWTTF